ncbi:hypothetical protein COV22_02025 [Candidatus Woesearchaeota archaeon CG10_big_fil_rev_8_21_14_0_10_47_5]|nr:MAG: hypothetical protein AUJ69_04355 [Candidatus Woesearchaeota archaeon CG1_02_47_18]PIN72889.1 MAG: hypothetical protein COV22_02025 [Candidatus Woesearchaeota archaeon CG10_big_fil_rev_8_21_14_0_10_47_5]
MPARIKKEDYRCRMQEQLLKGLEEQVVHHKNQKRHESNKKIISWKELLSHKNQSTQQLQTLPQTPLFLTLLKP